MKTQTVKLPDSFVFVLAKECAKRIHAAVITMHLRVAEGIWPGEPMDHTWAGQISRNEICEVRQIIRSLKGYDRVIFVENVRHVFQRLREEKGTTIKWQDYVANVRQAFEESRATAIAA